MDMAFSRRSPRFCAGGRSPPCRGNYREGYRRSFVGSELCFALRKNAQRRCAVQRFLSPAAAKSLSLVSPKELLLPGPVSFFSFLFPPLLISLLFAFFVRVSGKGRKFCERPLSVEALQSPVEGPTTRKKLVKTLRHLTQVFRGHARVRLALLSELRRTKHSAQNASAEKSEEIQLLRGMLRLDSRDPQVLLQCATVAFDSGRFYESLLLVNRALAGCTYTRETGPPREPESSARLACKEEGKTERLAPGELQQGDGTVLDDLFYTLTSQSPPCCFAADLHALRGRALVQLSREVAASREFSLDRDDFLFPRLPVREERTSSASSGDSCKDADSFSRSPFSPLPADKASSSLSEKLLAEAEAALRTALAVNPDNVEAQRTEAATSPLLPSPLKSLRFHSKTRTEPPSVPLPRESRPVAERKDEKAAEKSKRKTGTRGNQEEKRTERQTRATRPNKK
ncbi:putative transmembrane protein [Toxoplasma gondii GT1]|uniref:Putative transmembrane protein n=1 Tax=Toxoplasma gondii (strain ATCC 50853 / GT1) TaxID=507601 RepID=S7UMB4_TOXGG|nr:putative transmembrane protein [Toxoplasma gondii GT1]